MAAVTLISFTETAKSAPGQDIFTAYAAKEDSMTDTTENNGRNTGNITAVDSLGRSLAPVAGYKDDKYVGIFYFLWLGQQNQKNIHDITDINRKGDYDALLDTSSEKYPNNETYFFNEPLFGYYNSADPYVLRKHTELFISAGIDFLVFDVTNALLYNNVWLTFLGILDEYRTAGWKVPQIVFFTNTNSGNCVTSLYRSFYKKELYKELWFYGPYGKPLIIGKSAEIPDELKDFFYIREPQWPLEETKENGFPYMDLAKPQILYTDLMNVSVCQFAGPCSFGATQNKTAGDRYYGRGYSQKTPENGNVENILKGNNFAEQWENALAADPQIVFITGWNEWIAQKNPEGYGWIDTYNTEWSRDIEMTKARGYSSGDAYDYNEQGYGDNFYLQMIGYIRKFKGVAISEETYTRPTEKTIQVKESAAQWDGVTAAGNVFYNIAVQNTERDFMGASPDLHYTQAKADHFIKEIRVTNDKENVYFAVYTESDITEYSPEENDHLNLYIRVRSQDGTYEGASWEGFQYVINRYPVSDSVTSLEKVSADGRYEFEKTADISYSVQGNVMQLAVPLASLGVKAGKIRIDFKVTDSIENPSDIMDHYISGCSVPLGRLTYSYVNADPSPGGLSKTERMIIGVSGALTVAAAAATGILLFHRRRGKSGK